MRIILEGARGELRELARRIDAGERVELVLVPPAALEPDALSPLVRALRGLGLAEREAQIVELDYQGRTRPEISRKLYISENTVRWHWGRIYKRLEVHSRAEVRQRVTQLLAQP
ncbi:MAG TPA: LuxR C-terminal-related transcriptional regulator [Roseiflexaceae bacterium]|nr:LuxR C-terminal-related transcriptional regulator [Roseiflexaceae bacterium]